MICWPTRKSPSGKHLPCPLSRFCKANVLLHVPVVQVPFRDPRVELQSGEMVEDMHYISSLLAKVQHEGECHAPCTSR